METVQFIREQSRTMVRELNMLGHRFRDTGLTHSEIHSLIEVHAHRVLTAGELAEKLNLDKSTISRIVGSLHKSKLITIARAKHDARQMNLRLTAAGKKKLSTIDQQASRQVGAACELMDEEEVEAVQRGLRLYAKALWQRRQAEAFEVRPIVREDDEFVAKIIRQVMTEYGAVGPGFSIMDKEVDTMFESFDNDRSAYLVIGKNKEILGGGGVAPLAGAERQVCELKKMYFLPQLRGLGLGKKLLRQCLKRAKELGYTHCYLETLNRMNEANHLYRKFGFEPLDAPMGATGHVKCDAWYLRKL